jgi:hypothetical protein
MEWMLALIRYGQTVMRLSVWLLVPWPKDADFRILEVIGEY